MTLMIKSGEKDLPGTPFDTDEMENFDAAWNTLVRRYNYNQGLVQLFTDPEIREGILVCAQNFKKKRGIGFDGLTPESGFGMQPIHQFDIIGSSLTTPGAGLDNWFINWVSGDSLFWNAWLYDKAEAISTTAFGGSAANDIVPRDSNNDEWGVVIMGFEQLSTTSVVKDIRFRLNREVIGDFNVESQFLNSEFGIAEIGMLIYLMPGKPFSAGTHTIDIGTDAVRPIGMTFGTANRFRQTGANYRNRCQSA